MAFSTKLDYSNNRQVKQFQLSSTQLSGTTVFGVSDVLIPENFTGDTINIDALQFIKTRGVIFPNTLDLFTGTTYQLLGRDNSSGKLVEVSGGTGGVAPTGLEAIDEGNGIGWRLIGRDAANFGNIGEGSIDFSNGSAPSTIFGSTGYSSLTIGEDIANNSGWSMAFGFEHEIGTEGNISPYLYGNFIGGFGNKVYDWTNGSIVTGYYNTISKADADQNVSVVYSGGALGRGNNLYASRASFLLGEGLLGGSAYTTIVGLANVDLTSVTANANWSPSNTTANPAFIVGNGTVNHATQTPAYTRSNAFVVMRSGLATLPSTNNTQIDNEPTGKAVVTKEWFQANSGTTSTGLEALDEGNGIGHRIIGRDITKFGNIGFRAVDLGNSTSNGTFGASGDYATISGGLHHEIEQTANWATIGGGNFHSIRNTSDFATIGGGNNNTIINNSIYSTIAGGRGLTIDGSYATIGGGETNTISGGTGGTISGGQQQNLTGNYATISGGFYNTTSSFGEWVGGIYGTASTGSTTTIVGTDRLFNVGNGTAFGTRSNAFTILKNGLATLPSVTNTLIDAEPTGKVVITREWVQANSPISIKVTLTPAQIKTLNSAPVQLIPSPGAGKYIRIHSADAFLTWNSVAYNNFYPEIKTIGAVEPQLGFPTFFNKTENWNVQRHAGSATQSYVENAAVEVYADSDSAVGDSNVSFYITYSIVTL